MHGTRKTTKVRSRVTSGRSLFPKVEGALVDERTQYARRFADLLASHLNDLGGADMCSEAEKAIVRRSVTLIVALESMEADFATAGEGTPTQLELYARLGAQLRRMLESVGLKRRPKDITPDIRDYMAGRVARNGHTPTGRQRISTIDHEDGD
ncbi:hypothetical protein [Bradyrhizobium sp. URHD0069]|uniref:hypothetical protein n=1 Tax=Bradyrhizobium sp. URHD0069 TaxID=1380355 RepID=UPI00068EDA6C|nr:hypothetical protein [Bradyrhizobium sp. URHD0069]